LASLQGKRPRLTAGVELVVGADAVASSVEVHEHGELARVAGGREPTICRGSTE